MTTPTPRDAVEAFLMRHPDPGLRWTHEPALALDRIDLVASVTNQVRDNAIDQPTVDRYVAALQEDPPAQFPPVIVRPDTRSKVKVPMLVVVGGNHRTRAFLDAGRTTIEAYVIDCGDRTALEVAYGDNADHGLPPTDAERLAHALNLVELGRTASQAARIVGLDPQRLYKVQQTARVQKRAAELGVSSQLAQVSTATRPRLESLADDKLFVAVTKAIAEHGIGMVQANALIGDLNAQPTPKAAIDLLKVHVDHHRSVVDAKRQVGRPSANPYLMLRTALGTVRGLNPSDVLEACRTARERDELARLCMDGARHLKAIHDLARLADSEVA